MENNNKPTNVEPRVDEKQKTQNDTPKVNSDKQSSNTYAPRTNSGYRPNNQGSGQNTGYRPNNQGSGQNTGYRSNNQGQGQNTGYRPNNQGSGQNTGYRPNNQGQGQNTGYRPNNQGQGQNTGYRPNTDGQRRPFNPNNNTSGTRVVQRSNTGSDANKTNSQQRPPFRKPFDKASGGNAQGNNANARGGKRPPRRDNSRPRREDAYPDFSEKVVDIARVTKVVKGGRRFSFSAFVVVGNKKGRVGFGHGKANEVPDAIKKAIKDAQNSLIDVPVLKGTVPHEIQAKFLASKVMLKPASKGKGLIASGTVRAVVELAGYTDIVTKTYGSRSKSNTVKAAVKALKLLRTPEQIASIRDKDVKELL